MKDSAFDEAKAALLAIAAEADELKNAVGGSITEAVAGWLAPQYALAAREQLVELEGADRLKLLRAFVQDWALLRHGDQTAERLRIDRERLELEKAKSEEQIRQKLPELVKKFGTNGGSLTEEERAQRIREIFKRPLDRERNGGLSPATLAEIESAAKLL
jgi:hypothetical protein